MMTFLCYEQKVLLWFWHPRVVQWFLLLTSYRYPVIFFSTQAPVTPGLFSNVCSNFTITNDPPVSGCPTCTTVAPSLLKLLVSIFQPRYDRNPTEVLLFVSLLDSLHLLHLLLPLQKKCKVACRSPHCPPNSRECNGIKVSTFSVVNSILCLVVVWN